MKRDQYGFTLVNIEKMMDFSAQSFAFPLHVQQVFFSEDLKMLGWKVVLRKEPRGVWIHSHKDSMSEIEFLSLGRDVDHSGLILHNSLHDDTTVLEPVLQGA